MFTIASLSCIFNLSSESEYYKNSLRIKQHFNSFVPKIYSVNMFPTIFSCFAVSVWTPLYGWNIVWDMFVKQTLTYFIAPFSYAYGTKILLPQINTYNKKLYIDSTVKWNNVLDEPIAFIQFCSGTLCLTNGRW